MQIINLDKFKKVQAVELDGKQYEVQGITVDMYLNDPDFPLAGTGGATKEATQATINVLHRLSGIPKETLVNQPFSVLTALMQIAQGIDPGEPEQEGKEKTGARK